MRFAALVAVFSWVITYLSYRVISRGPSDDFQAALVVIIAGVVAVIATNAYIAMVFWNHRFW